MPLSTHSEPLPTRPRLVLLGAGHSHLEVLRRQITDPLPVELMVVSAGPRQHYSGMVPGYLAGRYSEEEITVEVPDLVARAGGELVVEPATGLDPARRRVLLASGEELAYDLVSVGVGSTAAGLEEARIAEHAFTVKPLSRVVELRNRLGTLAAESEGEPDIAVVGGGAAGVEIALATERILRGHGGRGRVSLYEAGAETLPGSGERFRRRAREVLRERGVTVRTGAEIVAVDADAVHLAGGACEPARLTVWLGGAVGWPWLARSGLPVDGRGFLLVDRALRSIGDRRVLAAGDCATLDDVRDLPKAGVYAVRHGPVLTASLEAAVRGGSPPRYEPQKSFLALLNTADGKALLRYRGVVAHARWAFWLKDWIDRRFLARYRPPSG